MTAGLLIDYLTCGGCGKEYPLKDITNFIDHKKIDCQDASTDRQAEKSPTCAREDSPVSPFESWEITQIGPNETVLSCFSCSQDFVTARGLLHHVQLSHNLKIFFQRDSFTKQPNPSAPEVQTTQEESPAELEETALGRTTVEMNQKDGTVKTNLSKSCAELAAAGGTTICCNSKECCVTIIPGTHERPKKCCSAIVPKKRKLHMEKHMSCEGGNEEGKGEEERKGGEDQEEGEEEMEEEEKENQEEDEQEDATSNDAIYIDFRPHGQRSEMASPKKGGNSWGTLEVRQGRSDETDNPDQAENLKPDKPVFMKPGMTFSIPVSYAYPPKSDNQTSQSQVGHPTPVLYSLPQQATFSVGTSNIMTISSNTSPYMVNSRQILRMKEQDGDSRSQDASEEGSREGDGDDERLMIDIDSDQMEDELGMDSDSADKSGGKKRRYPTSKPFKCDQCEQAFNQRIHLKKHMSKHTGVKPFKCEQCDYSTVERSHLKVHIRIHTGEKPFKCTFCEYATAQNSTLKIHQKRHHSGKMFECQMCNKKFQKKALLQLHLNEHLKTSSNVETIWHLLEGEDAEGLRRSAQSDPANQLQGNVPLMLLANQKTVSDQNFSSSQTEEQGQVDKESFTSKS